MATLEEQLDELLAMAADAGRLGAEHFAAEKARETALDRRRAGARARATREAWERAKRKLSGSRRRFLTQHGEQP